MNRYKIKTMDWITKKSTISKLRNNCFMIFISNLQINFFDFVIQLSDFTIENNTAFSFNECIK